MLLDSGGAVRLVDGSPIRLFVSSTAEQQSQQQWEKYFQVEYVGGGSQANGGGIPEIKKHARTHACTSEAFGSTRSSTIALVL
jgi:hypothetical protein